LLLRWIKKPQKASKWYTCNIKTQQTSTKMVHNNKPLKKNRKASYTKQQTHDKMQKGQTFWLEIPSYLQTKPKTNNKQRFLWTKRSNLVAWNTIIPANQAENEQQTTFFMNKKVEPCGLKYHHTCKPSRKWTTNNVFYEHKGRTLWLEIPSFLQTKPKTNNKQRLWTKRSNLLVCFCAKKVKYHHTWQNKPKNEAIVSYMRKRSPYLEKWK